MRWGGESGGGEFTLKRGVEEEVCKDRDHVARSLPGGI